MSEILLNRIPDLRRGWDGGAPILTTLSILGYVEGNLKLFWHIWHFIFLQYCLIPHCEGSWAVGVSSWEIRTLEFSPIHLVFTLCPSYFANSSFKAEFLWSLSPATLLWGELTTPSRLFYPSISTLGFLTAVWNKQRETLLQCLYWNNLRACLRGYYLS